MKQNHLSFHGQQYDVLENLCFEEIQKVIYENGKEKIPSFDTFKIAKKEVNVELPFRVNSGGGWTDTPPFCNDHGGVVLNAAIKLKGICPVQVSMHRIPELCIDFESTDIGVKGSVSTAEEV